MRRALAGIAMLCRVFATALALSFSGLPTLVAELAEADADCCDTPCEGADDSGRCPPNCSYGACAKTVSVPQQPSAPFVDRTPRPLLVEMGARNPLLSGFQTDVFHPPRG